tara:strand:+ start:122020 stop:122505 length:486 start_codon:yes stop_codon:yes gene_type:complete
MSTITSPLNFKKALTAPSLSFDVIALVDILIIALCFTLLGSRFIYAPGVAVDLPKVEQASLIGMPSVAVLTLKQKNMIFFEGRIYSAKTFQPHLLKESLEGMEHSQEAVLLVKLGYDVDMQTFLSICERAREAGFSKVQVAAEEAPIQGLFANELTAEGGA